MTHKIQIHELSSNLWSVVRKYLYYEEIIKLSLTNSKILALNNNIGLPSQVVYSPSIFNLAVSFKEKKIQIENPNSNLLKVTQEYCEYNDYYKNSWRMLFPGSAYIKFEFNCPTLPVNGMAMKIVHLTSLIGKNVFSSFVDFIINEKEFKMNYSPPSHSYMTDDWTVSKELLCLGTNTIMIKYRKEAESHYWIQSFRLTPF